MAGGEWRREMAVAAAGGSAGAAGAPEGAGGPPAGGPPAGAAGPADSTASIRHIAAAVARGEVVAVPTDTVYGLAVDPRSAAASEVLFALKGRPASLALPVLVAEPSEALLLAAPTTREALGLLAQAFWPGPLTVVVRASAGLGYVLGGDGATVGLRCPDHALLRRLLGVTGPLAVTSAHRHGEPPCTSAAAVAEVFADAGVRVLDGGACESDPSSVVSLVADPPCLLRRGSIAAGELATVLGVEVADLSAR